METDRTESDSAKKVVFNFQKGKFFRNIIVDGAWGGITPRGYINASIYSERATIPKTTEAEIIGGNNVSPEKVVESM